MNSMDDINDFACCCTAENMLEHVGNMIDDVESFVTDEDRKKLRQAHRLIREIIGDVWDRKHDVLQKLEVKE